MNIKAVILLLVVALATSHAEQRPHLKQRKLQFDLGNFGNGNLGNLVGNLVGSITGDVFQQISKSMTSTFQNAFGSITIPQQAIEALAQFGKDSGVAEVLSNLKTLGSDIDTNMKDLFDKIGSQFTKIGDKMMTVAGEVNAQVSASCPNIKRAQDQMQKGLESLVRSVDPDTLKKNAKYVKDLSIDSVTKIATEMKEKTKKWSEWTKDSFTKEFKIPNVEDIKSVGCDGACASECKAVKEASDKVLSSMINAVNVGKDQLKDVFSSEKPIGEEIVENMKEAGNKAAAQIQLLCSTTETLGQHITKLQENAEKIVKNYQDKFCNSASAEYIENSKKLMQCLFKNGNSAAIASSPIRKMTKSVGKALEGVSCKQKNGGRLNLGIIRKLKNVKFSLSPELLNLIKTDKDQVISRLKDSLKAGFNAADITITNLREATDGQRRQLSEGNAVGDVDVAVSDDNGLTVEPTSVDMIDSVGSEEEPQFAGSDLILQQSVSGATAVSVSAITILAMIAGSFL